jgi:hypothetical protein
MFEHPAYLNSGKKLCGRIYLLSFGKNYSCAPSEISINHIFANLMELEGISTKDLYTKTYFMS